jgi:putative DNA primase/helicase
MSSESATGIKATLTLAQSEAGIALTSPDLDADLWALNCRNGTVDLRTGELLPHDPAKLMTKMAPVHYDEDAKCPLWDAFLDKIMAGKKAMIRYLQRVGGMALTGDVSEQEMYVFYGVGQNGKSVFLDTLEGLMGDYACEAPPSLLTTPRYDQHPTEIADLCGQRLVIGSETEEGDRLRIQLVKRLTGNARLKGRKMRQDFFEFDRTHTLVLVTNNKPRIGETTLAVWRRVRLVPFSVIITEAEKDTQLLKKLRAEWPGILAWFVRGCLDWQQHGLQTPEEVKVATEQYQAEEDPLAEFLSERCILKPDLKAGRAAVYSAYRSWAEDAGEAHPLDQVAP